jgi:recombination protein RecA
MASAALSHLTQLLDSKHLAGTLTRPMEGGRPCVGTGVSLLDDAEHLAGGWPKGQLSEVIGPASSGRTSVVMATLAAVTQQGGMVALVDVADRLDPASAEAAGVVLDRLLWVRGPQLSWGASQMTVGDLAVQRGLRAFDLIVRAGGVAVVVFDVADVPARHLRSLPASTWLRLGHVLEGRDTVGLVMGAQPIGRSAHGVSLTLQAKGTWTGRSAQSRQLAGLSVTPDVSQRVRRVRTAQTSGKESTPCLFALSATL